MSARGSLNAAMELVRRAYRGKGARAIGALSSANVVVLLMATAQTVVVARLLGPTNYGIATLIMSVPNLLLSILQTRANFATVRFLSVFTARRDPRGALSMCKLGYSVDFGIALITFVAIAAAAPWIESTIIHTSGTTWLLILFAAALPINSLTGASRAILQTTGRFDRIATMTITGGAVRVGVVVALVAAGTGVAGVVIGNAVSQAFLGVGFLVLGNREARKWWGGSWLSSRIRDLGSELRAIGRFMVLTNISELISLGATQLDVILIGAIRGPTDAGLYRLAKNATRVKLVGGPLQQVVYPRLSKLIDERRKQRYRLYMQRVCLAGAGVGGAALAGVLLVPVLLPVVAGHSFEGAVTAAQLLLIGNGVSLVFFWLQPLYLAQRRVKAFTIINGITAAVLVGGFPIVISTWGLNGLAAWMAGVAIVQQGLLLLGLRGASPFPTDEAASTDESEGLREARGATSESP